MEKGEKMDNNFKYRVSVIIPIYNSEKYLEKCIESVLQNQGDISDIEIVLINDGSIDSSPQICEQYAEKYENVLYISKENEGGRRRFLNTTREEDK